MRGVRKGDRVVLLSENRLEWFTIEAGLQIQGAVTVPIYPTLTAQQAAYIIRDSGARVVIASSPEQQAKIAEVRDSLPDVEMIFTLDPPVAGSGTRSWSAVTDAGKGSRGVDSGAAERLAAAVSGDDVATIIYTSGTTGNPKGVMLSQQNLVHNTLASHEALTLTPEDRAISVLPYSHVFARMVAHYLLSARRGHDRHRREHGHPGPEHRRGPSHRDGPACPASTRRCGTGSSSRLLREVR